jgi:TolB-like protein
VTSEVFASVANALSPRYRLERTLQCGVAADVFLAEDRRHARWVAVKVLRDEMTATVDAQRFSAEIRLCAQLRHPNIVPVHESGEVDGLPFYVMPFIDGETLRARLSRLGRLPLTDALRITEDIARALDFAHRHHVVHRDIKPENIMLYRGRALVLDFGIALVLDALESPRQTLPGLTLGTVHYMSPEQAAGESHIDGRSDIYSLACVVYEMVSGRPPFTGPTVAVIRRHLAANPKPLSAVCPGASPNVSAVLSRSLQKNPIDRYATAGAFLAALTGAAPRLRVVGRRVAVLSFTHVNGDAVIDRASDGVGEYVAAGLRNLEGVVVAGVSSIEQNHVDLHFREIARRLEADVLLFGELRAGETPGHVDLSAVLIDGWNGRTLWAGRFAGPCDDGLERERGVIGRVTDGVAAALGVSARCQRVNGDVHEAMPHPCQPPLRATSHERTATR